jgi:hypothetical protein
MPSVRGDWRSCWSTMPPGPGPVGHRAGAARGRRPKPEGEPTRPKAGERPDRYLVSSSCLSKKNLNVVLAGNEEGFHFRNPVLLHPYKMHAGTALVQRYGLRVTAA